MVGGLGVVRCTVPVSKDHLSGGETVTGGEDEHSYVQFSTRTSRLGLTRSEVLQGIEVKFMKRVTLDLPLAGLGFKVERAHQYSKFLQLSALSQLETHIRCFAKNRSENPRNGQPLISHWRALEFKLERTLTNIPSVSIMFQQTELVASKIQFLTCKLCND